ncbi:energy-coupling factor ABC transporter substrate-binding protein [Wansuia hejianensis]|uniref:Cobalt transport protein CbiN n=1 Tax=Wansuia hejianensis TaxID=2763667 RepID=A0A926F3V7_9FIRM|nr:energy-coupling factor ABC transporter substrate-binding protein [Wansuia hejianensis]MBC8591409.1 energy-coupling factor ABC transporter substrate-binding protein [Wansuia hejianensis]
MKQSNKTNLLLLFLAIVIIITPLLLKKDSEFEGADGQAEGVIEEINPEYEPWMEPLWEPPSGEIESLLFSLQVAIGAGAIGYILGTFKERKKLANNR